MLNNSKNNKYCPFCKKSNVIRKGINSNYKQRYYCKDCKKYFQNNNKQIPIWAYKAYEDYNFNNIILKRLSNIYHKSIPTIKKYFNIIINKEIKDKELKDKNKHKNNNNVINTNNNDNNNNNNINNRHSINLIFDGTFLK